MIQAPEILWLKIKGKDNFCQVFLISQTQRFTKCSFVKSGMDMEN